MSNTISLDELRTIKLNRQRTAQVGVQVGDRITVGSLYAYQHDYEIYKDSLGVVAYIWPDYARASLVLVSGKLITVEIEDCVKVTK